MGRRVGGLPSFSGLSHTQMFREGEREWQENRARTGGREGQRKEKGKRERKDNGIKEVQKE